MTAAVIAACIAAAASIASAVISVLGRRDTKTTNGHSAGELIEDIHDRMVRIELWMVEHLRDHANQPTRRR